MATKTKNFNELRKRARHSDPDWDANVTERQRAIEDALALADLRQLGTSPRSSSPSSSESPRATSHGWRAAATSTLDAALLRRGARRAPRDRRRLRRGARCGSRRPRQARERRIAHAHSRGAGAHISRPTVRDSGEAPGRTRTCDPRIRSETERLGLAADARGFGPTIGVSQVLTKPGCGCLRLSCCPVVVQAGRMSPQASAPPRPRSSCG